MVELKTPLLHYSLYIHSSDHRLMWWMMCLPECLCSDSVSEASSASLDNSIYTTHCAWSHRINIWACLPFSRGAFGAFSEFITPRGRCLCSSLFSVSKITFCPSCRRVAYSARLKSKDLHLGDNRCLICAVMWDEVKADRETVMNLYKNVLSSMTTEPGGMHTMNYFHPFYFFTIIIPIHVCQLQ